MVINKTSSRPDYVLYLQYIQVLILGACFAANVLAYIIFFKYQSSFSRVICKLLQHQSILDSVICLLTIPVILHPVIETKGTQPIDWVKCCLWNSHWFYWPLSLISAWNLVLICIERYVSVVLPFHRYVLSEKRTLVMMIASIYVVPCAFMASRIVTFYITVDGNCVDMRNTIPHDKVFNGIIEFTASLWTVYDYFIPLAIFILLYASVIHTLRKHGHVPIASQRISTARKNLTKTAMVITICFIILIGFDVFYILLIRLGFIEHIDGGDIWNNLSHFLISLNSGINPVIYISTMPIFRKLLCSLASHLRVSRSDTRQSNLTVTRF